MDDFKLELCKCVLCHNAPCTKMYKNINPERIIRAVKFDNMKGAVALLNKNTQYLERNEKCEINCPMNVDIDKILEYVANNKSGNINANINSKDDYENVDISTTICGVRAENPFLLSSSVIGSTYEMCERALKQGWAGVATKTICLMDIHESSPRFSAVKDFDNTFMRI